MNEAREYPAILSQSLLEGDPIAYPDDSGSVPFHNIVALPNDSGFSMNYRSELGKGSAIFFNLYPGAMLIKFDGKFRNLDRANQLAARKFISSRVFSLRISERGTMRIRRGSLTSQSTPSTGVLSCYGKTSDKIEDIICTQFHTFNHLIFTENGLREVAKKTQTRLPQPLYSWLHQTNLSEAIQAFKISANLRNFVRSLNFRSLSYANNKAYIRLKYRELFLILAADLNENTKAGNRTQFGVQSTIQGVYNLVEHGHNFTLSTQKAAQLCDMNRVSFARAFARTYGESFSDYIRRKKFDKAISLLEQDRPLQEIATTCGFTELSNFSRAFKSYFGVPPGSFRKHQI